MSMKQNMQLLTRPIYTKKLMLHTHTCGKGGASNQRAGWLVQHAVQGEQAPSAAKMRPFSALNKCKSMLHTDRKINEVVVPSS